MTTPTISAALNTRATVARTVSISNGVPSVDDSPDQTPFWCSLSQSGTPRGFKYVSTATALGPRQNPPATLRHASGLTGPTLDLRAGDRVSLLSYGVYELLDSGVQLTTGQRIVGVEFAALPVAVLYPLSGIISDMDGNPQGDMILGIWSPVESHNVAAGEYEDYLGLAPVEFGMSLMRNVDIMVGTVRYRILASETDLNTMAVNLQLRKADEPLAP